MHAKHEDHIHSSEVRISLITHMRTISHYTCFPCGVNYNPMLSVGYIKLKHLHCSHRIKPRLVTTDIEYTSCEYSASVGLFDFQLF